MEVRDCTSMGTKSSEQAHLIPLNKSQIDLGIGINQSRIDKNLKQLMRAMDISL